MIEPVTWYFCIDRGHIDFAGENQDNVMRPLGDFQNEADMNDWSEFTLAMVTFFLLHSLPVRPAVKARIINLIGARQFTFFYSCVSIVALGWLIVAASRAPYLELWSPAPWQHMAALLVMAGVCLIVAFTLARPNPFSFGGSSGTGFDPSHAGIVRIHRHPLLLSFFLWAGVHLLPNGDLAHVILFGLFAWFSLIGMKLIDRRTRRQLGADEFEALRATVNQAPLLQSFARDNVLTRTAAGLGLFAALLILHPLIIGVSPVAALY